MENGLEKLEKRYLAAVSEIEAMARTMKEDLRKKSASLIKVVLIGAILLSLSSALVFASPTNSTAVSTNYGLMKGYMAIGMGLAVGLAGVGAGLAIAATGASTISATVEKPEAFTRGFIIVTLAEALAIYGLIVAILIWISF